MTKNKISAIVNTRNEEENLEDCLKSLSFVDEIVVVDMESSDKTVEIAKKYTDKVFNHKMTGYVEPARNFAIKKAVNAWVLVVDADERIPKTLAQKLIDISDESKVDFVRIPRKNIIFNKWIEHSLWWPDLNIRFFKKGSVEWQNEIHSVPITYGTGLNLPAEEGFALEHHHYQTIDEYLTRAMRYSRQQAAELTESGYIMDVKDFISKPFSEFISRFFAAEGYKDGLHGLILSLLQAFSIFLIYLRVWQESDYKKVSPKELKTIWQPTFIKKAKEFYYWLYTIKISEESSKVKKIILKLRRRLTQ